MQNMISAPDAAAGEAADEKGRNLWYTAPVCGIFYRARRARLRKRKRGA